MKEGLELSKYYMSHDNPQDGDEKNCLEKTDNPIITTKCTEEINLNKSVELQTKSNEIDEEKADEDQDLIKDGSTDLLIWEATKQIIHQKIVEKVHVQKFAEETYELQEQNEELKKKEIEIYSEQDNLLKVIEIDGHQLDYLMTVTSNIKEITVKLSENIDKLQTMSNQLQVMKLKQKTVKLYDQLMAKKKLYQDKMKIKQLEIEYLQENVRNYENDNIDKMNDTNIKLKSDIVEMVDINSQLQTNINNLEKQIKMKKEEYANQKINLKNSIEEKTVQLKHLQDLRKINELQNNQIVKDLEKKIKENTEKLSTLKTKNIEFLQEISKVGDKLAADKNEVDHLQEKCQQLEMKENELKSMFEKKKENYLNSETTMNDKNNQISCKLEKAANQLSVIIDDNQRANQELEEIKISHTSKRDLIDVKKKQEITIKSDIDKSRIILDETYSVHQVNLEKNEYLKKALEAIEIDISNNDTEITNLTKKVDNQIIEHKEEFDTLKAQLDIKYNNLDKKRIYLLASKEYREHSLKTLNEEILIVEKSIEQISIENIEDQLKEKNAIVAMKKSQIEKMKQTIPQKSIHAKRKNLTPPSILKSEKIIKTSAKTVHFSEIHSIKSDETVKNETTDNRARNLNELLKQIKMRRDTFK